MERQKQGFDYELDVIKRFSLVKEENYTGKWDAYYIGIPVSIKYEKKLVATWRTCGLLQTSRNWRRFLFTLWLL